MSKVDLLSVSLLAGLAAAACGTSRTSPATQTTVKAFDAAKSDPKAVAIADQVVAALGGEANWTKAKEIVWTQGIILDGKLADVVTHAWDRWNGRHQYTKFFADGVRTIGMHELFSDTSFSMVETAEGRSKQRQEDKAALIKEARVRFDKDTYPIFLPFKLKDPGVKLTYSEERPDWNASAPDAPKNFDVIKITFEPGVGPNAGDTWYLVVNKETHMPSWIEHVGEGKDDTMRSGALLQDWVEVGGLKFATRRVTLGYTKLDGPKATLAIPPAWQKMVPFEPMEVPATGEIELIRNLKVNPTPTDDLYVPDVTKSVNM